MRTYYFDMQDGVPIRDPADFAPTPALLSIAKSWLGDLVTIIASRTQFTRSSSLMNLAQKFIANPSNRTFIGLPSLLKRANKGRIGTGTGHDH
jgi:chitinase